MKAKLSLFVGILAVALILPGLVQANCGSCEGTKGEGSGHKHVGSMSKHAGSDTKRMEECKKMNEGKAMCPSYMEGADIKVKNVKNGVEVRITSKDKAVVKKIQERAKKCLECKDKIAKAGEEMVTCPVMGSTFPKSKAVATKEYKGKTYYLCCKSCIGKWDKDPAKYAK
jgi:YHS domain-containing protein